MNTESGSLGRRSGRTITKGTAAPRQERRLGTIVSFAVLLPALIFSSGCAGVAKNSQSVPTAGTGVAVMGTASAPDGFVAGDSTVAGDLTDSGADLEAVPLAINRQVLQWIDYFQGQGRPHMERYLSRSTRYMPLMKKILKERGVPEDLIYIALIESGFNGTARSTANAVGYWQFIRGTGKRYGLRIDTYTDDRRDFIRSTEAAADYFKGLYDIFHSWYLAIASYNVGENRVKNLITKYHTRDFWQLARENKLPEETSNYVPKFIAARLIAKNPEKYGFTDIDYMPPAEFDEVEVKNSVDLRKMAQAMNLEYDDLRDLNPAYKRGVAFAPKNAVEGRFKLRVPKGSASAAETAWSGSIPEDKKIYATDEDYIYYRVRKGETISSIARKFSTSQGNIRELNGLSANARLSIGRRLRVPGENAPDLDARPSRSKRPSSQMNAIQNGGSSQGAKPRLVSATSVAGLTKNKAVSLRAPASKNSKRIYIVQSGDTLAEIARRYRVSLGELTKHNRLSRRTKVLSGMRLEIPQ